MMGEIVLLGSLRDQRLEVVRKEGVVVELLMREEAIGLRNVDLLFLISCLSPLLFFLFRRKSSEKLAFGRKLVNLLLERF